MAIRRWSDPAATCRLCPTGLIWLPDTNLSSCGSRLPARWTAVCARPRCSSIGPPTAPSGQPSTSSARAWAWIPGGWRRRTPVCGNRAIESYSPKGHESLTARVLEGGQWDEVERHLEAGGMVGLAVDYGVYRRRARAKAGSRSFDGFHAIPIKGIDKAKGKRPARPLRTRSFDPLLDGRYRGCPDGPVMVDLVTVRDAALRVGLSAKGRPSVYALLMDRAVKVVSGVDTARSKADKPDADKLEVEEPLSLASILVELMELDLPDLSGPIADLEALIGPYRGDCIDEEPEEAVMIGQVAPGGRG